MVEDEKKETQDETSEAAADAAEESSGVTPPDDSSTTPPADDAGEADDSSAAGEEKAEEAPAVEASPEDDLPWKEKQRLERSRRAHEARPQRSVEERKAERAEQRKRQAAERRKERAVAKTKKVAGTGTPAAERDAVAAKVRQGIVVSDKAEKSIVVRIDVVRRHPTYEKVVRNTRTLHVHDERNEAGEGDTVRVVETRPLSKTKRWRLTEILEKAR
jgi:small subunit ribosomal protein S17